MRTDRHMKSRSTGYRAGYRAGNRRPCIAICTKGLLYGNEAAIIRMVMAVFFRPFSPENRPGAGSRIFIRRAYTKMHIHSRSVYVFRTICVRKFLLPGDTYPGIRYVSYRTASAYAASNQFRKLPFQDGNSFLLERINDHGTGKNTFI